MGISELEPGLFAVWYNGWLAGILDPFGHGVMAAGAGANEDTLIAALEKYKTENRIA
jgi:hypothetical protein